MYVFTDAKFNLHQYCLAVYYVPSNFIPTILSHGNAKSLKPFYPTLPSTVERIKHESTSIGPKETVAVVSCKVGGVLDASCPGALPRSEQQVSDYKRRTSTTGSPASRFKGDDLYTVMLTAHMEDPSHQFVRDVKAYPEPAIVVGLNQQFNDIVRFCTSSHEHCILTVDPTFCLGDFDVTPTTYRLIVECKRTTISPVMLGPTMIHYRKSFATYLFLASALIGQSKEIEKLRVFGTDGEKPLVDAFTHEFPFALHLSCFLHVRRNVKDELATTNFTQEKKSEILDDIFGKRIGTTFYEGLVDANNEVEFEDKLNALLCKWKKDEDEDEVFFDWFLKNKVNVIKNSMLRPVCEEAGLGSPPVAFYTNASETINATIKAKVQYKRNELPQFISKLRELASEQQQEVEKAVIGRGKYKLRQDYKHLEVSETKWFAMSRDQRSKHLKKISTISVSDTNDFSTEDCADSFTMTSPTHGSTMKSSTHGSAMKSSLSADIMCLAPYIGLPVAALEAMCAKAKELTETDGAITLAPGQSPLARMVLSRTGKRPHLVTPKRKGGFACDDDCPQYCSSGLCSHVIAVAESTGMLSDLVSTVRKQKRNPNITKLVTTTMPKGRGRKGGKAPIKRKPATDIEHRYELNPLVGNGNSSNNTGAAINVSCTEAMQTVNVSFPSTVDLSCSSTFSPYSLLPPMVPPVLPPASSVLAPLIPTIPPPFSVLSSPSHLQGQFVDPTNGGLNPFRLCFIFGNISVCHGCKNRYAKTAGAPQDLCIQHEEWRTFSVPNIPTPQQRFGNVYYHPSVPCIQSVWAYFDPQTIVIPPEIVPLLQDSHKQLIRLQFGIQL